MSKLCIYKTWAHEYDPWEFDERGEKYRSHMWSYIRIGLRKIFGWPSNGKLFGIHRTNWEYDYSKAYWFLWLEIRIGKGSEWE